MKIINTETKDGLILTGLFFEGSKKGPVIIHIHGYEGDFYSNKFIYTIAEKATKDGCSLLSIQTRGTGCISYFNKIPYGSGGKTIGSYLEKIEDSHLDISAWINKLKDLGYSKFILQGHSLGTIKAVRYLFEGEFREEIFKVILLAPFDKNFLLNAAASIVKTDILSQRSIAEKMVQGGKGDTLAPYGFDDVPHSYNNFLSWSTTNDLGCIFDFHNKKYDFPILSKISIPTFILVGSLDEFFYPSDPQKPEEVIEKLKTLNININGQIIIGCKHSFAGFEDNLANIVSDFVTQ